MDDHGTFVGNAHEFAAWAASGAAKVWTASHHTVHNVMIDWVDDNTANVECYVLAFNQRSGDAEDIEIFAGRYVDRFERRDDAWRIANRLALRDVDSLMISRRWAGKINVGGRYPRRPELHRDLGVTAAVSPTGSRTAP